MPVQKNNVVKVYGQGGKTFAVYWNGNRFETSEVPAETRVTGTSEIFEVYEAYLCGIHFRTAENIQDEQWMNREQDRRRIKQGRLVRVVKGRKVKPGIQGILFYMKETIYGVNCGLRTSDRKDARGRWQDAVWVDLKNLCVVDPKSNRLLLPLYQG